MWMNAKALAAYLGKSKSWIEKKKGKDFFEGVHYVKKEKSVLYCIEEIEKWLREGSGGGEREIRTPQNAT